jgi:phage/plasmid-like protein (TIGR03299 family)
MAHELEIGINGQASFASLREPAWHGLGTVFEDEVTTAEMLSLANLNDWDVRLEEIPLPENHQSHKSHFFVSRTNPFDRNETDVLGVVGERYKVLQNEELFDFASAMLHDGGRWETAGSIKNGTQVFGSIALERESVIDPNGVSDKINTYLLVNTSHDGSVSIQASVTPVRVVCANTLNLALGGGTGRHRAIKQSFKIRHTQSAAGKIQVAREALGLANIYMDEFDKMAQELFEKEISYDKFQDIIRFAYPMPELANNKRAMTMWNKKIDSLEEIYTGEFNHTIAGTAWGALNAMTERLDWHRSVRGENSESMLVNASGFDVATNAEKNRLLNIVQSVVAA